MVKNTGLLRWPAFHLEASIHVKDTVAVRWASEDRKRRSLGRFNDLDLQTSAESATSRMFSVHEEDVDEAEHPEQRTACQRRHKIGPIRSPAYIN